MCRLAAKYRGSLNGGIMLSTSKILKMTHQFNRFYSQELGRVADTHKMSRVELDVLLFLHNNPDYDTARDIVEYRLLAKSYVSKAVDLLIRRRFLAAVEDSRDRRILHLTICGAASGILKEALSAQQTIFKTAVKGIPEKELSVMEKVMSQMSENISSF